MRLQRIFLVLVALVVVTWMAFRVLRRLASLQPPVQPSQVTEPLGSIAPSPPPVVDWTAAPMPHTRSATITGIVLDPAGRPVAHARVGASPSWTSNSRYSIESARTDAGGGFKLEEIEPGERVVVTVDAPMVSNGEAGVAAPAYPQFSETIEAPATNVRLQFSHGNSLEGTVVNDEGTELSNVDVSLQAAGKTQWVTQTDSRGNFHFDRLGTRRYRILARLVPSHEGELMEYAAAEVSVSATSQRRVTVQFPPTEAVTGTLLDDRDRPVAGAVINVSALRDDADSGRAEGTVRSHADGSFSVVVPHGSHVSLTVKELPGFEDGTTIADAGGDPVRIVLHHETFLSGRVLTPLREPIPQFRADTKDFSDAGGRFRLSSRDFHDDLLKIAAEGFAETGVAVPEHEGRDYDLGDIVLNEGRTVVGLIFDGATKQPVEGAAVGWALDCRRHPQPKRCVVSDEHGRFTLYRVPNTTHSLWVERDGFLKSHVPLTDAPMYVEVTLDHGASIEGHVLTAAGHPRAGVEVRAEGDGSTGVASTDRTGYFHLVALDEGSYILKTVADDGILPQRVKLKAHDTAQLDLRPPPPGTRVLVRVVDEAGAPVNITDAWAVPGDVAHRINNSDASNARRMKETAYEATTLSGELVIQRLPPGKATVVVERGDLPYAVTATIPSKSHYELVIHVPEAFCSIDPFDDDVP